MTSARTTTSGAVDRAVERPTRWPEAIAFGALSAIVLQAISGFGLAFHYVPSADLAYPSIVAIQTDLPDAAGLRLCHIVGANFAIGLSMLTLLQAFVRGAYKKPGRGAWVTSALILLVVVGLGITGELLPWTQQGVFATEVRTGLVGQAPVVGHALQQAVVGGDAVAAPTLLRFYALHVFVLPLVLVLLITLHWRAARRLNEAGHAVWVNFREAGAACLVTGLVLLAASRQPATLGSPYVAGDAGYQAWPEWHFLWLNKLLRIVPPSLESLPAFWIPNGLAALLVLLPFVDRNQRRSWRHRKVALAGAAILIGALAGLSIADQKDRPKNDPTLPFALEMNAQVRRGYQLVRRNGCIECHAYHFDDVDVGKTAHDAPDLDDMEPDASATDYADMIGDPLGVIGTEDMPPYAFVPFEERRMMGLYLRWLNR